MVKEFFIDVDFRQKSLNLLRECNEIIDIYTGQGLRLTLRQLYYQLVARNLIPNDNRSYKNLGKLLSQGRLAGEVDWEAIEDRLRKPEKVTEWNNPQQIMDAVVSSYKMPRWDTQPTYCEIWVEKDALAGVLQPITDDLHVTLMVNRGYSSQSAMKESAGRWQMEQERHPGREKKLFYIGDLDPSGEDMIRDVEGRLELLAPGLDCEVIKVAITPGQVTEFNPPPNPTKVSDSRAEGFIAKFGYECYEADAIPPDALAAIIRQTIEDEIDWDLWDEVTETENRDVELLREASDWVMGKRLTEEGETDG